MTDQNTYTGFPAASGVVIGKAFVIDRHHLCVLEQILPSEVIDDEIRRFEDAVERCNNEMQELRDTAAAQLDEELPFSIFDAYTQILKDPSMIREVSTIIRDNSYNAEWALSILLDRYRKTFSRFKDTYYQERLQDIDQVITRLQRQLIREEPDTLAHLSEPAILIAHDLTPADTLQMDREKVIGFAIDVGGKTSHAGILASSMDIPAVVGLKNFSQMVKTGDHIIVDGSTGEVVHLPNPEQFTRYNKRRQKLIYFDKTVLEQKDLKAVTLDGFEAQVMANIESSGDIPHLAEHGAEGVGLYRTEFLYLNREDWPDEETQFEEYRKIAEATAPHYAVVRTLDIGGDKISAAANYDREPNPALGLRAIRFCLNNPEIFKTQLRAILRASHYGDVKIMYPMITAVEEIQQANAILEECKRELDESKTPYNRDIDVGIMIETPSSVMIADILARECSFFSIGTNDLIQYTMAIDRINEQVAYLYEPLSPAILRMLANTVEAGRQNGIPVSVCGKMAGDPAYALFLLGLDGIVSLSMDTHSIPRMKKFIRSIDHGKAAQIAREALSISVAEEVKNYMRGQLQGLLKEGITSDLVGNVD